MNPQKKILNSLLSSISVLVTICSSNYLEFTYNHFCHSLEEANISLSTNM